MLKHKSYYTTEKLMICVSYFFKIYFWVLGLREVYKFINQALLKYFLEFYAKKKKKHRDLFDFMLC